MPVEEQTTVRIYKARKNLLNILETQDYEIMEYNEFSINEVHVMNKNKQLDMLLENSDKTKKVYIKYNLGKTLRPANLYELIDDLFHIEEVLELTDNLIIVVGDEPNDTIIKTLNHIWEKDKIFITIINIKRLQFNVLNHQWVPSHTILSDDQVSEFKTKYNITKNTQIPTISRYDPVALCIGIRPDQICRISRSSKTAIISEYYRICV
jgi:DNA-directed RNA polymerase subunit H (RpoH/RPB5)